LKTGKGHKHQQTNTTRQGTPEKKSNPRNRQDIQKPRDMKPEGMLRIAVIDPCDYESTY